MSEHHLLFVISPTILRGIKINVHYCFSQSQVITQVNKNIFSQIENMLRSECLPHNQHWLLIVEGWTYLRLEHMLIRNLYIYNYMIYLTLNISNCIYIQKVKIKIICPSMQAPINCSSTCICHSYITSTLSASMCKREQICCMFRTGGSQTAYAVRVHGGGCSAYQSFVNLDPSFPVAKWPEPGMEIEWALPQELVCQSPVDCREMRNSRCSADPASLGVRRCFCKRGWRWDAIYGLCRSE